MAQLAMALDVLTPRRGAAQSAVSQLAPRRGADNARCHSWRQGVVLHNAQCHSWVGAKAWCSSIDKLYTQIGNVDRLHNIIEPFAALFWALGFVLAHILQ